VRELAPARRKVFAAAQLQHTRHGSQTAQLAQARGDGVGARVGLEGEQDNVHDRH
jgi:hypothetical protein